MAVVAAMAPVLTELSLHHNSSSCSAIQKQRVEQQQQQQNDREQTQTIRKFLACLEEERKNIEGFEHELPLCMQLLRTEIECYKQELKMCHTKQGKRPVQEEVKNSGVNRMTQNSAGGGYGMGHNKRVIIGSDSMEGQAPAWPPPTQKISRRY